MLHKTKGPSADPQPVGKDILSFTCYPGLFLGQWDRGLRNAKGRTTIQFFMVGSRWVKETMSSWCYKVKASPGIFGGRDNSHSQGEEELRSVCCFQFGQSTQPSSPQAVLHYPCLLLFP